MFNLAFLQELAPIVRGNITSVGLPPALSVHGTWSVRFVLRPRSTDHVIAVLASVVPQTQHRFSAGQLYLAFDGTPEEVRDAVLAVVQQCTAPTMSPSDVPYVPKPTLLPLIADQIWEQAPQWPEVAGLFPATEVRAGPVPLLIVASGPSPAELDDLVLSRTTNPNHSTGRPSLAAERVVWKAPHTLEKSVPGNRNTFILSHPVDQSDTGPSIGQLVAHQHLLGGAGSVLWDVVRDGLAWCYDIANLPFQSASASLNITTFSTAVRAEIVLEKLGQIWDDPRCSEADVAMSGFMRWMSAGRFDGSILDIITNLIANTPSWNDIHNRLVELASLTPAVVSKGLEKTVNTRGFITVFSGSGN